MKPYIFDTDLYEDNGELVYSQTQQPEPNQLQNHYEYIKPFLERTQGRIAVDIGSRFGEYTHYLLKHFEHVICFEPNTGAVSKFFNRNIPKDRVTVYNCGLGARSETVQMSGAIIANSTNTTDRPPHKLVSDIPIRRLDSFEFRDIDFIKIDVEGYELKVLQGAVGTLLRNHGVMIVMEQSGEEVKWDWGEQNEATDFLTTMGYVSTGKRIHDYVFESPNY